VERGQAAAALSMQERLGLLKKEKTRNGTVWKDSERE